MVPDPGAERPGQLRVIDESGGDYLHPTANFLEIEVPNGVADTLRRVGRTGPESA